MITENVGRAYLHFARNEPAYYSAMFEAGVSLDTDPALRAASEASFAVLRGAAERLVALMPPQGRPVRGGCDQVPREPPPVWGSTP